MYETQEKDKFTEGKKIAIIAYLTIIGLVIAFLMNKEKNNEFAKFHIRQNLGLFVIGLLSSIIQFIPIIGQIAGPIIGLLLFVLWIIGLLGAINNKEKEVPFVGNMFQKWFNTL